MKHSEFECKTLDELTLQGQGWHPDGKIRAVVCLIHGLGEHSGRYDHMAEAFNHGGVAMLSFDLRGHGRSEGRRGHALSYTLLMSDIEKLLSEAAIRYPNVPCFLYGHSLGGNLAIHYALKHKPSLAGIIASAPLLRMAFKPPAWKTALLDALHALHLNLSISSGLEQPALCRDPTVVQSYQHDPLVHDRITSVSASVEFAERLGQRCTLKIWKGLYHELHNEPEKEQVLAYVHTWMDAHANGSR